jgi:hypothetical protein
MSQPQRTQESGRISDTEFEEMVAVLLGVDPGRSPGNSARRKKGRYGGGEDVRRELDERGEVDVARASGSRHVGGGLLDPVRHA